jgi:hypothetical protein
MGDFVFRGLYEIGMGWDISKPSRLPALEALSFEHLLDWLDQLMRVLDE